MELESYDSNDHNNTLVSTKQSMSSKPMWRRFQSITHYPVMPIPQTNATSH